MMMMIRRVIFRFAYRLGSYYWHFAEIIDLPREDQGMIELLLESERLGPW
jgi:hypothetical protein